MPKPFWCQPVTIVVLGEKEGHLPHCLQAGGPGDSPHAFAKAFHPSFSIVGIKGSGGGSVLKDRLQRQRQHEVRQGRGGQRSGFRQPGDLDKFHTWQH